MTKTIKFKNNDSFEVKFIKALEEGGEEWQKLFVSLLEKLKYGSSRGPIKLSPAEAGYLWVGLNQLFEMDNEPFQLPIEVKRSRRKGIGDFSKASKIQTDFIISNYLQHIDGPRSKEVMDFVNRLADKKITDSDIPKDSPDNNTPDAGTPKDGPDKKLPKPEFTITSNAAVYDVLMDSVERVYALVNTGYSVSKAVAEVVAEINNHDVTVIRLKSHFYIWYILGHAH